MAHGDISREQGFSLEGRQGRFCSVQVARFTGNLTMTADKKALEEIVLTRMVRLNATVQGVVTGLMAGLGIFVATNWLVIKGGEVVGPHLALLGQFFIGYRVTFGGSLIGAAYGFVCGFVVGASVAKMYNWLVNLKEGRRRGRV
jgi:hypothetical protein